jgi:hypothetical protein
LNAALARLQAIPATIKPPKVIIADSPDTSLADVFGTIYQNKGGG